MFERLRMQEVKKIIFSVPEGGAIGEILGLQTGDPIMIINKPNTSDLTFISRTKFNESGKGFVNLTGSTSTIDFTINDGSVLFTLWSYLHGRVVKDCIAPVPAIEEIISEDDTLTLSNTPVTTKKAVALYKLENGILQYISKDDFTINDNVVTLDFTTDGESFTAVYDYQANANMVSFIKQLHNSILCAVDIFIDAVDLVTGEKHTVYVRIDRAQLDTDLKLFLNDSAKASFTPIKIYAIPEGSSGNRSMATIVVV